jgi:hypothetical protein
VQRDRRTKPGLESVTLHSNRGLVPLPLQHCPRFHCKVIALKSRYSAAWSKIPTDEHAGLVKRLGNLALLYKRMNSKAANFDFSTKKPYFAASKIKLTNAADSQ